MRNSLGISTGAAGVCSALVSSDDTGVQDVEYRTISADLGTQTDPGDLALSAIGLMTTQVPDRRIEPDAIAVAYRTESQAAAVRSAAKSQKRAIRLVPETAATLTYLRSTGLVAQYGIIALVDLGASGLTVTIVDQADGTVFFRDRTATVSADAAADETADDAGSRVAEFVAEAFAQALQRPEALVLVGGGGRIPGIASALETTFDGTTIEVAEPEAATAKGAALLAGSAERQKFPLVTGSGGRVSGALVAAVVVGGLMLGYGVKEMVPQSEENYSPTGSQVIETPTTVPYQPPPSPQETWLPTNDPRPTTTVPVPQPPLSVPVPTYDYSTPEPSTSYPTFEETPPTTSEPSPEPTTTPSTTTPPPTTTTPPPEDLPWIPPKWPELPTWLPEIPSISPPDTEVPPTTEPPETSGPAETPEQNPESGPATGSSDTAAPPTTTAAPAPEAPIAAVPRITPESGSPTPEVPDSSPR
ncbi:exopolyphosphatase [Rhodococcus sp. (in: high G+C Gram-positive bacteria)]|uniref:exopolyphosphatase n=1 Tax=Rhodococcus sp. TaxID=1831 RepID=UPI003B8A8612